MTKVMLNGMTDKPAEELIPLAKSWSNPAEIVLSDNQHDAEYTTVERAYTIVLNGETSELGFTLKANEESPVVNPAFVVENWGNAGLELQVNGSMVNQGKDFRYDLRESLDKRDLIVWLRLESKDEISFLLTKKSMN
jgi:hypothetical protein